MRPTNGLINVQPASAQATDRAQYCKQDNNKETEHRTSTWQTPHVNTAAHRTLTGLCETENKRQIAGDPFFFQDFRGFDSLPCGRNLDENA